MWRTASGCRLTMPEGGVHARRDGHGAAVKGVEEGVHVRHGRPLNRGSSRLGVEAL